MISGTEIRTDCDLVDLHLPRNDMVHHWLSLTLSLIAN